MKTKPPTLGRDGPLSANRGAMFPDLGGLQTLTAAVRATTTPRVSRIPHATAGRGPTTYCGAVPVIDQLQAHPGLRGSSLGLANAALKPTRSRKR